jgi:hypothetical protein
MKICSPIRRKGEQMKRAGKSFGAVAAAFALILATAASAGAVTVNDNTVGPGPVGANCAHPDFSSIGAAAAAAFPGAQILVCAGEYTEGVLANKQLSFRGPQAGVDARTRATTPAQEAIVRNETGDGIDVSSSGVSIDGFTFTTASGNAGIGLRAGNTATRIENDVFSEIAAGYAVNGIFEAPTLRHNLVTGSRIGFESNTKPATAAHVEANRFVDTAWYDVNFIEGGFGILVAENVRSGGEGNFAVLFKSTGANVRGNRVEGAGSSAVYLGGGNTSTTVSGNTFANLPGASGVSIANEFGDGRNSQPRITGNTLTGDKRGVNLGAASASGVVEAHFNRIVGNSTAGIANASGAPVNAERNWWGCNGGPGQPGCDTVATMPGSGVDFDPWLVLGLTATPATVLAGGGQSQLVADLTHDSTGKAVGAGFPDGTPIAFAEPTALGTVSPSSAGTSAGTAASVFTAGAATGTADLTATLDGQVVHAPVAIEAAPSE